MQTIKITTSQNIDIDYEVAGVGERTLARLLDLALFVVIYILGIIISIFMSSKIGSASTFVVLIIIYVALFVFYDLICEIFTNGQSFGKRIMKIKVISLDGKRPSFGQYLLRWLFRIIDFTLSMQVCALLCAAVSEKQQRVGDMVAGTTLIKTHPRTSIKSIAFSPSANNYEPVFKEAALLTDRDIVLIRDVINTYYKTRNEMIVYNMADRIEKHLSIAMPEKMNNMQFLQTIIKDYSHIAVQTEI
jgi:uncharacterized RDD family membrane protein YckC